MKCPYCDAIVPRGKTVCGFCGEPLPEMNPPVRSSKDEAGSFSPDKGPTPVSTEAPMTHEQLSSGAILNSRSRNSRLNCSGSGLWGSSPGR